MIWDVLAGRARFPARAASTGSTAGTGSTPSTASTASTGGTASTGLDGRPVPVEQAGPAASPLRLMAAQLIEPFQAQR